MPKIILSISVFVALLSGLNSEIIAQSNWELGFRIGERSGLDITIPLAAAPRLHATAYLFDKYVAGGGYFDWMFSIEDGPNGLKFFPGVGSEIYLGPEVDIAAVGDFGAEYSFDFPLTIGIDWRPRFMLTDNLKFGYTNIGITARFRFGEGVKFVKEE